MNQSVLVQVLKGVAKPDGNRQAVFRPHPVLPRQHFLQRLWSIRRDLSRADGAVQRGVRSGVVRQFHDVKEIPGRVVAPDVQNVHLVFLCARNRFEALNAGELAIERARFLEAGAIDHFHRAIDAGDAPGEPDFAIGATPDRAQQFVVRNDGRRACHAIALVHEHRSKRKPEFKVRTAV